MHHERLLLAAVHFSSWAACSAPSKAYSFELFPGIGEWAREGAGNRSSCPNFGCRRKVRCFVHEAMLLLQSAAPKSLTTHRSSFWKQASPGACRSRCLLREKIYCVRAVCFAQRKRLSAAAMRLVASPEPPSPRRFTHGATPTPTLRFARTPSEPIAERRISVRETNAKTQC